MKRFSWLTLILLVAVISSSSCTNFQWDALGTRYKDNMDGGVAHPGDVTVADANNFSFVVMGDTHIGNPAGGVLQNAIARASAAGANFAVVAGDLTDNGDAGQYRQFRSVMSGVSMAFRAAIGNHDIFFGGWNNFKQELGRSIYSFNAGSIHFVMLDSANGVLGEDQLNWLESDLRAYSSAQVVLVSHFPPWNGEFSSLFKLSSDEEIAILKDICYRYNVDYFLSGHYHGFAETVLGGTRYIVTGGVNDLIDPGQRQNYLHFSVTSGQLTYQRVNLN